MSQRAIEAAVVHEVEGQGALRFRHHGVLHHSARLRPSVVDAVVLQWEDQLQFFPDGIVLGPVR